MCTSPAWFEFYILLFWHRKAEAVLLLFRKNQMNPLLSKSLHNGFGMNEQGNVDLCRAGVEETITSNFESLGSLLWHERTDCDPYSMTETVLSQGEDESCMQQSDNMMNGAIELKGGRKK